MPYRNAVQHREQQYRVICKAVVNVAIGPITAETPQQAVDEALDAVGWSDLFLNVQEAGLRRQLAGQRVQWTDFGEEYVLFVVDPIDGDGELDCENAVWLTASGTPAKEMKA